MEYGIVIREISDDIMGRIFSYVDNILISRWKCASEFPKLANRWGMREEGAIKKQKRNFAGGRYP